MKLEMATFPVGDVKFSGQTRYSDAVLEINKEELVTLILEDRRVASADLDVAFPGEQTRIVNVRDVVEPRVKVSGPGCIFPGILGPVETVGEGRTHRLSGVTVIASADYIPTILSGTAAQNSSILDMWGPAAEVTPFGSTINIVLVFRLTEGVTELEAHAAIQSAEFRVAHRLAETVIHLNPDNLEVFELFEVDPSLPRVVYIDSFLTNWQAPHSLVAYYGLSIRESLPTFVHPNEFFDGALTCDARIGSAEYTYTWGWINPPVVLRLLREHGKRLNFLGVILQRTRFEAEHGKQVTAACTAQMASQLKADGAIITRTVPSGANFVDVMLTVQACEKKGVKTVLLTPEWGGKDGTELPLVFYVPEATAMVNTGSTDREYKLAAPAKIIGVDEGGLVRLYSGDRPFSPWNEITVDGHGPTGTCDWWGEGYYTRIGY
ncbi:MAG: glycine/sarcosine/betaine reductase component B subunit [Candidatus Binatia bacterium]